MTISLLLREKIIVFIGEVSPSSSWEVYFVVFNKSGGIVKLFNIIQSVILEVITFPEDQILNSLVFIFFDSTPVEESFYLKAFQLISIAFYNHEK